MLFAKSCVKLRISPVYPWLLASDSIIPQVVFPPESSGSFVYPPSSCNKKLNINSKPVPVGNGPE